jgi:4-hydroxy-2-oxoheptanedioate aldolase
MNGNRPRLNQIIARRTQDRPAFTGEHWQLFGIEHNPFLITTIQKNFQDLRPEGSMHPIRTPIVRIEMDADQDFRHMVKQWLDVGAFGVIVPLVRNADQVRKLVAAHRYPHQRVLDANRPREPQGERGYAAATAARYWGIPEEEYAEKADTWPLNPRGEILAISMMEHIEAVKNLKEILAVPGLGAITIGQSDLSISMGLGTPAGANDAQNKPEVQSVVADVIRQCVERSRTSQGPICGTFQGDQPTRIKQGIRLFVQARGPDYRD